MKRYLLLLLLPYMSIVGCDNDENCTFTIVRSGQVTNSFSINLDRSDESLVDQLVSYVKLIDPATGQINKDNWIGEYENHKIGLTHTSHYSFEQNSNDTYAIYRYTDSGEAYPEVSGFKANTKQDQHYFEAMLIERMLENIRRAESISSPDK